MNVFTTDKHLYELGLVVLEDEKNMYPSFICGFVLDEDLKKEYPEVVDLFESKCAMYREREN